MPACGNHCCYILLTSRTSLSLKYSRCLLAANSIFVHKLRFMTSPGRWYATTHWRWSWQANFAIHKTFSLSLSMKMWRRKPQRKYVHIQTFISRHSMIRMPLYVSIHSKHVNFDICIIFSRDKCPYKFEALIKKYEYMNVDILSEFARSEIDVMRIQMMLIFWFEC